MSVHPFTLAVEHRFPGLFEIVLDHDDATDIEQNAQNECLQLSARARSLSGDPGADLTVHFDFGEYSVGIGWLAHTHFDNHQLSKVLNLLESLSLGSVGCLETLSFDGALRSARMIDFSDAQSGKIPPLEPEDKSFRIRFFTGLGDVDGSS